ncbi:MAG: hypothetical protein U1F48_05650 [Burkholderiales bacterium]
MAEHSADLCLSDVRKRPRCLVFLLPLDNSPLQGAPLALKLVDLPINGGGVLQIRRHVEVLTGLCFERGDLGLCLLDLRRMGGDKALTR